MVSPVVPPTLPSGTFSERGGERGDICFVLIFFAVFWGWMGFFSDRFNEGLVMVSGCYYDFNLL